MTSSHLKPFPCHCLSPPLASPGPTCIFFHPHELSPSSPGGHLSSIPCPPPRGRRVHVRCLPLTQVLMQKRPLHSVSWWAASIPCPLGRERCTAVSCPPPRPPNLQMQVTSLFRKRTPGAHGVPESQLAQSRDRVQGLQRSLRSWAPAPSRICSWPLREGSRPWGR